jgi:hypothetical protein
MEFPTDNNDCFYIDKYHKKYYKIIEATQYGVGLVDIKVRECKLKFDSMNLRQIPNVINYKEFIEEEIFELVPFGRKKKLPHYLSLRIYELQDKFIYIKVKNQ